MIQTHTFEVGGKTLSLEVGRVAKQAGGAVLLGMGETVILATATMSKKPREGIDFLPLVCDYEERKYAVGKIPGGFIKRGGRPSEKAILVSRLIDRPIRPLFPKGLFHDVQVIAMPFAVDQDCPPDALAITAAGAALAVSDIPFKGPVAGVRVGLVDGDFVLFPTQEQIQVSDLDLIVAGHEGAISMVEAGANEVSERVLVDALALAHEAIRTMCREIAAFAERVGKPKREVPLHHIDPEVIRLVREEQGARIEAAILDPDKASRESAQDELVEELVKEYTPRFEAEPEKVDALRGAIDKAIKDTVRRLILEQDKRPDGRGLRDIRALSAEAGLLPRVHGSGLFTRGQTQVMTVCTLGMPSDAQILDGLEEEEDKRYMHFYNFPPYSVGEVRPLRAPGRREVGHGALAERALRPVVPIDDPDFPYTIQLISEVLESNGSTSMAAVCGSSLALMDAGVPIKAPVAGIAMGLMSDGHTFKVLTDIQGLEDFAGDMDFKVAGTRKGVTALQLDTKLEGIPERVLVEALEQAREARMKVLDVIEEALPGPRPELSPNAPRITTITINPDKIGAVIGPGGSVIRKITTESGAQIDIQQDGRVLIAASDGESARQAIDAILAITATAEVGAEFQGRVTRLMGKGALVEYLPGKEGLVPLEHLTPQRIRRPDDVVRVGDEIAVRVYEIDSMGRVNLTALGLKQTLSTLQGNETASSEGVIVGGGGGRDRGQRERGGPERGGSDRGGSDRGGSDRGGQERHGDRNRPRDRGEARAQGGGSGERARPEADRPPTVPDEFPRRGKGAEDDSVNARFRPRR